MQATVTIRAFRPEDIERTLAINAANWRRAFRTVYSRERIQAQLAKKQSAAYRQRSLALIARGRFQLDVAVHHGQVVGYISYTRVKDGIYIYALYIDPAYHRQGIGSRLLRLVERKTRARLYRTISASRPATVRFWEKHGYRKVRIVRRSHGDVDVVMKKVC